MEVLRIGEAMSLFEGGKNTVAVGREAMAMSLFEGGGKNKVAMSLFEGGGENKVAISLFEGEKKVVDLDLSWNPEVDDRHPDESEGESASGVTGEDESDSFCDGRRLVQVGEENLQDTFVKDKFVNIMFALGLQTIVSTVHKNLFPSATWQAKLHTFLIFSRVLENISKGCGKVRYAWFGGSKDEIKSILRYGFSSRGRGVCFSPFDNPLASLRGAAKDENGLCHLILCRVLLGNSEVVSPSSQQRTPSSEKFHSGVDDLSSPRVYMIWSTHMNTHVVPQYVVSFRPPVPVKGKGKEGVGSVAAAPAIRKPNSPWMPFSELLSELAKIVPQNTIGTLQKYHYDHRAGKIKRMQLIQKLRQLVGDHVLFRTITSYRNKLEASDGFKKFTPSNSNNLVAPHLDGLKKFTPSRSEVAFQIDGSRKPTPSNRSCYAALSQYVKPMKSSSNRVLKKIKKLQTEGSGCTDRASVSSSRNVHLV